MLVHTRIVLPPSFLFLRVVVLWVRRLFEGIVWVGARAGAFIWRAVAFDVVLLIFVKRQLPARTVVRLTLPQIRHRSPLLNLHHFLVLK